MARLRGMALFACLIALAGAAQAEFHYDNFYFIVYHNPKYWGPDESLWEFDPVTGQSQMFIHIPHEIGAGSIGATFTPDGRYLLINGLDRILAIDGNGTVSVFMH